MAPRTLKYPQGAGSFVTLSISKAGLSRLSLDGDNDSTSVPPKSATGTGTNKKAIANSSSKSGRAPTTSITTPVTTPSKRRRKPTQVASSQSSFPTSNLVGDARSDDITDNHDGDENPVPSTRSGSRSQGKSSRKGDTDLLDGQTERRSSTASLADSVTRLSHRNRKLTSKAQALAGTNFLPSLNHVMDIESRCSPTLIEPLNGPVADKVHKNASNTSQPETLDVSFNEDPVESVETPSVRTSARQRKPTARAIELGNGGTSHKRPASPATSERSYKMAKNSPSAVIKPSRLRHSAVEVEKIARNETDQQLGEKPASAEDEGPRSLHRDQKATRKIPKRSPPRNTSSRAVTKKTANGLLHDESWSGKHEEFKTTDQYEAAISIGSDSPDYSSEPDHRTAAQIEADNKKDLRWLEAEFPPPGPEQATAAQAKQFEDSVPDCDLSCLTPSNCLLAFAEIAADLSDSDSDAGTDDEELLYNDCDLDHGPSRFTAAQDILGILGALRPTHCQCPNETTQLLVQPSPALEADDERNIVSVSSQPHVNKVDKSTLKPRSDKSGEVQQQVAVSELNRQKTSEEKPIMIRLGSSFEKRMQADYLSLQREKTKVPPHSSAHVAGRRANSSNVEKFSLAATFSPKPIRFAVNGNHTDTTSVQTENQIPESTVAVHKTNHEPLANSSSAKAMAPKLEHRHGPAGASVFRPTTVQDFLLTRVQPKPATECVKSKAGAAAGKNITRVNGKPSATKPSAAGSVRTSLQSNKTGQQQNPATKQSQSGTAPLPMKQTSIKLRFNLSSR